MQLLLLFSVLIPFFLVAVLTLTVCIVICVYLKENFKLSRIFGRSYQSRESRLDKEFENEMLRREFNSKTHMELQEEGDDEKRVGGIKKEVMMFYLDMMKREEYKSQKTQQLDNSNETETLDDGHHCYPLCEKKFEDGDIIRYVSPCGHAFHEGCIKIWLYKGENQFCPNCRGNFMKDGVNLE